MYAYRVLYDVKKTWFRALATSHKGKSRVNAPVVTDPATCTVVGLF
eukprot:COSAG01_NODE_13220_length_1617_cov_11.884717_1_plen_45_part_10